MAKYLIEAFPETIVDEKGYTQSVCVTHKRSPDLGFGITLHDVPCHVCFDAPAVNTTEPCWKCQEEGYRTIKATPLVLASLKMMGVIDK